MYPKILCSCILASSKSGFIMPFNYNFHYALLEIYCQIFLENLKVTTSYNNIDNQLDATITVYY